jgi:hypothetical protein
MSAEEIVGSIFGGLVCLGVAVGGSYCLVKCLPTPNTPDLEAPETPEEVTGPPKKTFKTIKALLEPVLRTKVQKEPMVDPVDPIDQVEPMDQLDPSQVDPTDQMDPTVTISTATTASYKSIIG